MTPETMNAIVVKKYGEISQLVSQTVPKPGPPEGQDLLVRYVYVCSCTLSALVVSVYLMGGSSKS